METMLKLWGIVKITHRGRYKCKRISFDNGGWTSIASTRIRSSLVKKKWEVERTSMIKTVIKDYMDMGILDILQLDTLPHLGHILLEHIQQHQGHMGTLHKDILLEHIHQHQGHMGTLHKDILLLHTHRQDTLVHLRHHIKGTAWGQC